MSLSELTGGPTQAKNPGHFVRRHSPSLVVRQPQIQRRKFSLEFKVGGHLFQELCVLRKWATSRVFSPVNKNDWNQGFSVNKFQEPFYNFQFLNCKWRLSSEPQRHVHLTSKSFSFFLEQLFYNATRLTEFSLSVSWGPKEQGSGPDSTSKRWTTRTPCLWTRTGLAVNRFCKTLLYYRGSPSFARPCLYLHPATQLF